MSSDDRMHLFLHVVPKFTWNKTKYSVTFQRINIDSYAPIPGKKTTAREGWLCIIRKSNTGAPFTGISILHPLEKKTCNHSTGMKVALKRAMRSIIADEWGPIIARYWSKAMYRAYRLAWMELYNHDAYVEMLKDQAAREQAHLDMIAEKEALDKQKKLERKLEEESKQLTDEEKVEEEVLLQLLGVLLG